MNLIEKSAILTLQSIKGLSSITYKKGIEIYSSPIEFLKKVYKRTPEEFEEEYLDQVLVLGEEKYPFQLSQINDPPLTLFYKGDDQLLNSNRIISIVGTRGVTKYGENMTRSIARDLSKAGYVVVSGLAYGVDTIAHKATLEAGGKTVAVLGTNINHPHPKANTRLFNQICSEGIVISETENAKFHKGMFPRRNRIIAGLSEITIVVEAPRRSGALITAHLAFDYNREVYAVPGNIGQKNSEGTNHLIKINKAKLLSNVEDIIGEHNLKFKISEGKNYKNLSEQELGLVELLKRKTYNPDELAILRKTPISIVNSDLSMLEIKKVVAKDASGNYTLVV